MEAGGYQPKKSHHEGPGKKKQVRKAEIRKQKVEASLGTCDSQFFFLTSVFSS